MKEEEEQAHKKYLEDIKHDEMLAKKLQEEDIHHTNQQSFSKSEPKIIKRKNMKVSTNRSQIKSKTIDNYLSKLRTPIKE